MGTETNVSITNRFDNLRRIGQRKKIRVLTFRALALRQSESRIRSDEGLTLATSELEYFYGGQFICS